MNAAHDPVLRALSEAVQADAAAATVAETLPRGTRQLEATAELMAREVVPLEVFGGGLPESIRSCWIFVIRPGASTGAERHPNSHQRLFGSPGSAGDVRLVRWCELAFPPAHEYGRWQRGPAVDQHSAVDGAPAPRRSGSVEACSRSTRSLQRSYPSRRGP